ncbi:predicted protein [Naegleria gruberi]|uniref:Predicted protein n=1 Tax=Naegleria gruberi TaxID=5762 RepID=D2VUH2_NAEGR|nr:uncharacterized protein NAEGRDRAFT_52353 [Naegleria gruberi]EFC39511.1 predicted protein [Naegleria gruberi]|eukprot:XP_002672255.1 predicted protein [Naegleria gruberi strain NEG-M]
MLQSSSKGTSSSNNNNLNKKELERQFTEVALRHRKAIQDYEKTLEEYKELYKTLTFIPQSLKQSCMIPIGTHQLAFMPGQLVQTNEITVSLGENYFIKTSAYQAREILKRRIKKVMEKLEQERKLLHTVYEGIGLSKHSNILKEEQKKSKREEEEYQDMSEATKLEQMFREMEMNSNGSLPDFSEMEDIELPYNSKGMDRDELYYRHKTTRKDEEDILEILEELEREEATDMKKGGVNINLNKHIEEEEDEEDEGEEFGEEEKRLQQDILKYFHRATGGASTEPKQQPKKSQQPPKQSSSTMKDTTSFNIVERDALPSQSSIFKASPGNTTHEQPKKVSKFKQRMMENK